MSQHQLFGDKLVDEGYITQDELRVALKEQKISGKKTGRGFNYLRVFVSGSFA